MVLLHMKRSEQDQFLYDATVKSQVKDTIRDLVEINNLRHRIERLKLEGEELAKYGPSKPLDKQGIDQFSEGPVEKGPHYNMDPTGRRTGNACAKDVAEVLLKTLESAVQASSKDQVSKKVALTTKALEEAIDNVRGAVMICYPMGLPEWDLVRLCLEGTEDLSGTAYAADELDPDTSTLWFAGKQMMPEKQLSDYLGKNDKSKAIVKLQKKGQGAPGREPVVDEATQKAMLAYYYKKQEEQKKLQEDDDDSFANSAWANPKTLKAQFNGLSQIRVPR